MKKTYFLFLVLLFPFISKAQIWVKENAVWHYAFYNHFENGIPNIFGFYKIEHVKDTVLDSKLSKKFINTMYKFKEDEFGITSFLGTTESEAIYTATKGDTVFFWFNNKFEILYNFSATANDIWQIGIGGNVSAGCSDTSTVNVTGEGTVNIDGQNYKYLDLFSDDSSGYKMRGRYNSRFGFYQHINSNYGYVFPLMSWPCDPQIPDEITPLTFLCFQDDSLYYNPSGVECEYMLTHVGLKGVDKLNFKIYPNPSEYEINIEAQNELDEIKIYNVDGICVFQNKLFGFKQQISPNLSSGVYIAKIKVLNNKALTHKMILR